MSTEVIFPCNQEALDCPYFYPTTKFKGKKCPTCGWNPVEAERRKQMIQPEQISTIEDVVKNPNFKKDEDGNYGLNLNKRK